MRKMDYNCEILAGKPGRKSQVGNLRCKWMDTIKMGIEDTRWDGVN
jgi:hypothetical protein